MDYFKFWSPAFDTMEDFIFLIDADFNLKYVNKSFLDFTGKERDFFSGKKCYEVVHGTAQPVKECPQWIMLQTKKFTKAEYYDPNLKKWLYVRVTPIFDEANNLIGSIHIASDITDRKTAEEELRRKIESLERFQRITVGRELKMKELKSKIADLEAKLGVK